MRTEVERATIGDPINQGLKVFIFYPGHIAQGALRNDYQRSPLLRKWGCGIQHGDGSSHTYRLGYSLI
jgi:hypothetical protein